MQSRLHTLDPGVLRTILPEFDGFKDNLDSDGNILSDYSQQVFGDTPLHAFSSAGWGVNEVAEADRFWTSVGSGVKQKLKLRSASPHLLVNGRVSTTGVSRSSETDSIADRAHRSGHLSSR